MTRKERLARGKGAKKKRAKERKKALKMKSIEEAQEQIGGDASYYIIDEKRDETDFEGKYWRKIPEDYHRFHFGRMAIRDEASREMVFMVRFTSFSEMAAEEIEEIRNLTTSLIDLSKISNKVAGNASHKKGDGSMYALGWRGGYDGGLSLGRYCPSAPTQKSSEKLNKWKEGQDVTIPLIHELYRRRFSKMASKVFEQASREASELGIPGFSQTEFVDLKPEEDTFAGNLTYTFGDFCNSFHKDNDYNSYTYGIWAPSVLKTGELITAADNINFKRDGGQFVIPTYKVQVDYSKHVGIVEMIWRGKTDFHATLRSKRVDGFTWLGTSVQISQELVFRLWKVVQDYTPEERNTRVRGVEQIMIETDKTK